MLTKKVLFLDNDSFVFQSFLLQLSSFHPSESFSFFKLGQPQESESFSLIFLIQLSLLPLSFIPGQSNLPKPILLILFLFLLLNLGSISRRLHSQSLEQNLYLFKLRLLLEPDSLSLPLNLLLHLLTPISLLVKLILNLLLLLGSPLVPLLQLPLPLPLIILHLLLPSLLVLRKLLALLSQLVLFLLDQLLESPELSLILQPLLVVSFPLLLFFTLSALLLLEEAGTLLLVEGFVVGDDLVHHLNVWGCILV